MVITQEKPHLYNETGTLDLDEQEIFIYGKVFSGGGFGRTYYSYDDEMKRYIDIRYESYQRDED